MSITTIAEWKTRRPPAAVRDLHDTTPQFGDTRPRSAVDYAGLSTGENDLLRHVSMFGSEAYPIAKAGRGWHWNDSHGVPGPPVVYKTKAAGVAAFELFLDILRDKAAGRL